MTSRVDDFLAPVLDANRDFPQLLAPHFEGGLPSPKMVLSYRASGSGGCVHTTSRRILAWINGFGEYRPEPEAQVSIAYLAGVARGTFRCN